MTTTTSLMSWDEWVTYDAVGLAELLRQKKVTPRELAEQVAAGIRAVNPKINAVIEVFDDVVRDPTKDGMRPDGPFEGWREQLKMLAREVIQPVQTPAANE